MYAYIELNEHRVVIGTTECSKPITEEEKEFLPWIPVDTYDPNNLRRYYTEDGQFGPHPDPNHRWEIDPTTGEFIQIEAREPTEEERPYPGS